MSLLNKIKLRNSDVEYDICSQALAISTLSTNADITDAALMVSPGTEVAYNAGSANGCPTENCVVKIKKIDSNNIMLNCYSLIEDRQYYKTYLNGVWSDIWTFTEPGTDGVSYTFKGEGGTEVSTTGTVVTISSPKYENASQSVAGLMSPDDKRKLDELGNSNISLSGASMSIGSYQGTGTSGILNMTSISFDVTPGYVVINTSSNQPTTMIKGQEYLNDLTLFWYGNSVAWFNNSDPAIQLNESGKTYHFVSFGDGVADTTEYTVAAGGGIETYASTAQVGEPVVFSATESGKTANDFIITDADSGDELNVSIISHYGYFYLTMPEKNIIIQIKQDENYYSITVDSSTSNLTNETVTIQPTSAKAGDIVSISMNNADFNTYYYDLRIKYESNDAIEEIDYETNWDGSIRTFTMINHDVYIEIIANSLVGQTTATKYNASKTETYKYEEVESTNLPSVEGINCTKDVGAEIVTEYAFSDSEGFYATAVKKVDYNKAAEEAESYAVNANAVYTWDLNNDDGTTAWYTWTPLQAAEKTLTGTSYTLGTQISEVKLDSSAIENIANNYEHYETLNGKYIYYINESNNLYAYAFDTELSSNK